MQLRQMAHVQSTFGVRSSRVLYVRLVEIMLSVLKEQRINVKFLVKLEKSATETHSLLKQVYGDGCLSRTQVFEWHKRFKEGRDEIEDDPRSGRPSTSTTPENINKICNVIRKDRRLSEMK